MPTGPDLRWSPRDVLAEDTALELGIEAYIYGYPLVLADVTRRVMTSGAGSGLRARAPLNRLAHLRAFPDHTFTDIVSPDVDTLTSSAWLSLAKEPVIFSLPPISGRYFLVTVMDAWTNIVASLAPRTIGASGGLFAIVGPGWQGALLPDAAIIASPTNLVWLSARFETRSVDDYATVHAIQDDCALEPLRSWGRPGGAAIAAPNQLGFDGLTPPAQQVARMEARTFFARLNHLMRDNPPAVADAPTLERLGAIGVAPGEAFDLHAFDPTVVEGLERSTKAGHAVLIAESRLPAHARVNGWDVLPPETGAFGTDYTGRAVVALVAFGACARDDCACAFATVDGANRPLTGEHRYALRFAAGALPPVDACWSISLYNAKHAFVAEAHRHALGGHDRLAAGADGSTTIAIQRDPPADGDTRNWLPAPPGMFTVGARFWAPQPAILDGRWRLPPIVRVP